MPLIRKKFHITCFVASFKKKAIKKLFFFSRQRLSLETVIRAPWRYVHTSPKRFDEYFLYSLPGGHIISVLYFLLSTKYEGTYIWCPSASTNTYCTVYRSYNICSLFSSLYDLHSTTSTGLLKLFSMWAHDSQHTHFTSPIFGDDSAHRICRSRVLRAFIRLVHHQLMWRYLNLECNAWPYGTRSAMALCIAWKSRKIKNWLAHNIVKYRPKTMSNKKNWLIEFTDITVFERDSIVRIIKDPNIPDDVNHEKGLVCAVVSLFYRQSKDLRFITNMRVRIQQHADFHDNKLTLLSCICFSFILRLTYNLMKKSNGTPLRICLTK